MQNTPTATSASPSTLDQIGACTGRPGFDCETTIPTINPNRATTNPNAITVSPVLIHASSVLSAAKNTLGSFIGISTSNFGPVDRQMTAIGEEAGACICFLQQRQALRKGARAKFFSHGLGDLGPRVRITVTRQDVYKRQPLNTVELTPEQHTQVQKIIDILEDDDDVQHVYHNIKQD